MREMEDVLKKLGAMGGPGLTANNRMGAQSFSFKEVGFGRFCQQLGCSRISQ